jgi:small subunit ribosomal protein S8
LDLKNTIEVKMSLNDPLANALSLILIDEKAGRNESEIKPSSKIVKKVLDVMKASNYVGSFEEIKDGGGNMIKLNLLGNINKCGVIKPRYSIKKDEFEKFEEMYLLARGMGILIVSTPLGIITHNEAKKKNIGGKLLAYCY